ncbi:MAG: hypothetical protein AB8G11_05885 [Saprospiraceae bacterium]
MKAIKIIIVSLLIISGFSVNAQNYFTHNATAENTKGHITTINSAITNNNTNKLLFVTQVYSGPYNNHPFGVWYNNGKWTIYQENKVSLAKNENYNVLAVNPSDKAFQHKATASNISSNWTTIDHPSCNNNPNAVLLVTQNWKGTYNPKSIGVWYNSGKWTIYNQDRTAMPAGTNFNVLVLKKGKGNVTGGTASIFTSTTSTVNKSYKHLADLPYKGKDVKIFTTQNYGTRGPYNNHETAVWNYGSNWTVYNKDKTNLPTNAKFNMLVIGARELLPADEELDEIVVSKPQGELSTKAGYVRIFNESGYIAKATVTYYQNGTLQTKSTGSLIINGSATIDIPKGVSDIKVKAESNDIAKWDLIFDKKFGANPPNKCFKLYGTAFNPQYNNNCASKPTGGYVKFFNESGYVAKFTVTYTFKGETIKTESGNVALGARKTMKIPNEATNIRVKAEGSTVVSWTTIFEKTYTSPPNKCFKVYATIFSPEWNNNCD